MPLADMPGTIASRESLARELAAWKEFGKPTTIFETAGASFDGDPVRVDTYVNEFWTAAQRAANNLHEISFRACFKPQLPHFFIERLTRPGEVVYDPFMGRGTTLIEAALMGRVPFGCDVNPLSIVMAGPRLRPPELESIAARLTLIDFKDHDEFPEDLLVFYHPDTLREICALKKYLLTRQSSGGLDALDRWIQLVALNRLTGHSPGFFSVYTLPPNQAVSVKSQIKINEKRNQTPPRRMVPQIILKKSRALLSDCGKEVRATLLKAGSQAVLVTSECDRTPQIPSDSVSLVVTSPPFLNIVDYATDNWLRCWFIGVDAKSVKLTVPRQMTEWKEVMTRVFIELRRVLKSGGHVAFEVGEVHAGKTRLEDAVLPCGIASGLEPQLLVINDQEFTKTANCWGVDNNAKGTNTNRILLFKKP